MRNFKIMIYMILSGLTGFIFGLSVCITYLKIMTMIFGVEEALNNIVILIICYIIGMTSGWLSSKLLCPKFIKLLNIY